MKSILTHSALLAAALGGTFVLTNPTPAQACGGFFCGQSPVDQSAERIVFAVDQEANTTDMIVQIAFAGAAPDFAWVVPLADVPVEGSLDTFPQAALTALDANTAPQINNGGFCLDAAAEGGGGEPPPMSGEVMVHVREEVGPYDVAVIESDDSEALVRWLRENDFRVTTPMEPYIEEYTASGMKFLALRLQPIAKVSEIEPFRMTLPGTAPSIPLRMTALAAEPEMGIAAFILGEMRYAGANWPNLEVPDDYIVVEGWGRSNWTSAVARVVNEAGGKGWVTEFAGSLEDLKRRLENTTPADEEQEEAVNALTELLAPHSYMTRLYSRLSAEEMDTDPMFRRDRGGDVERWRSILPEGAGDCGWVEPADVDECAFATCGAGGHCVEVEVDGEDVAACACIPGATARTTFAPDGTATVICQDTRMSFLNPGDIEVPGEAPLPDTCVGFDCGAGTCVTVNMTPTCVCNEGFVAVGAIDEDGVRSTNCIEPASPSAIPDNFYEGRLPELATPAGREDMIMPEPAPELDYLDCSAGNTTPKGLLLALSVMGLALSRRRRRF